MLAAGGAEGRGNADLMQVDLCGKVQAVGLDGENLQKLVGAPQALEEGLDICEGCCVDRVACPVSSYEALGLDLQTCVEDMEVYPMEFENWEPCGL